MSEWNESSDITFFGDDGKPGSEHGPTLGVFEAEWREPCRATDQRG